MLDPSPHGTVLAGGDARTGRHQVTRRAEETAVAAWSSDLHDEDEDEELLAALLASARWVRSTST